VRATEKNMTEEKSVAELWLETEEAEEAAKKAGEAYASANQTYAEAKRKYQEAVRKVGK